MRIVLRVVQVSLLMACVFVAQRSTAAEWEEISRELIASEKPGYGGLTGVVVHPVNGDVFAFLSEKGLYRSEDQGTTWKRHGDEIKGRTEWPGAINLLPTDWSVPEKFRLDDCFVIATVYGGPIVWSDTGGDHWKQMDKASVHVDWVASAADVRVPKFVLALKHESGEVLLRSTDGGKSFDELGKDFGPACVFDENTAVVLRGADGKRKALRTTDAGKTFEPCADWNTRALPQRHGGKIYWLVDGAIVTTDDKGASWKEVCAVKGGKFGPVFGKDAKHMLVLTDKGIIESRDGGANWSEPIALAKGLQSNSPLTWLGFDAKKDVFYVAQMGAPLFRLQRGK